MKIHEVQENLRNAIAGKEQMLAEYQEARKLATMAEDAALYATVSFLKVNIDELKRILQDVDKAVEQYNELAWMVNPAQSEK